MKHAACVNWAHLKSTAATTKLTNFRLKCLKYPHATIITKTKQQQQKSVKIKGFDIAYPHTTIITTNRETPKLKCFEILPYLGVSVLLGTAKTQLCVYSAAALTEFSGFFEGKCLRVKFDHKARGKHATDPRMFQIKQDGSEN